MLKKLAHLKQTSIIEETRANEYYATLSEYSISESPGRLEDIPTKLYQLCSEPQQ